MQDTVRDAVFGNVGTMISFRVSADDSPILAKQFEPQFEPNDLLQMHNRNFIINMVINGEKAPAFSAKTLNLPTYQDDNTGRIIQWTREHYSRNRSDIEADIAARVLPPSNLTVKSPRQASANTTPPKNAEPTTAKPAANQTNKPIAKQPSVKLDSGSVGLLQIDHGKQAATGEPAPTAAEPAAASSSPAPEAPVKPKRKRTRRRRKTSAKTASEA